MREEEGKCTSAAAVQEEEKDTRIPYNHTRLTSSGEACPKCGDQTSPHVLWVAERGFARLGYLFGRCQRCKAELFKMRPRDTIYTDADPA